MTDHLRVPPHNIEAEQAVLGGLQLDCSKFWNLRLTENDFYRHDHRLVWRAISALALANKPADAVTVGEWLETAGLLDEAGGLAYLGVLVRGAPGTANIEAYADIVSDRARLRDGIRAMNDGAERLFAGGLPEEVMGDVLAALERGTRGNYQTFEAMNAVLDAHVEHVAQHGSNGVPFGIPALDEYVSVEGPKLIIVAARPSLGKTALVLQGMINAGRRHQIPAGFVSLETDAKTVVARMNAHLYQIAMTGILKGWSNVVSLYRQKRKERPYKLPFYLEENTYDLGGIVARISEWHRKHSVAWVCVDHLQLIDHKSDTAKSQNNLLGEITRRLKLSAKRTGIPHILVCQLNRENEALGHKPGLHNLRESGRIEEDADVVIMLHGKRDVDSSGERYVEIGVMKNKDGETGWLPAQFKFNGRTQTFRQGELTREAVA